MNTGTPYPDDVTDEEWAFVAPPLAPVREDAPRRPHGPREIFNALRRLARTEAPRRMPPHDLSPWQAVHGQARRWPAAGAFAPIAHDLRRFLAAVYTTVRGVEAERVHRSRDAVNPVALLDSAVDRCYM